MLLTARLALAALCVAGVAASGLAAPVPTERAKAEKDRAALAAKLRGEWRAGPCEGEITFRENGTYTWTGIGPGGDHHEGKWALRGEPAAPVLILKCKTADYKDLVGKTVELPVVRLDETGFAIKSTEAPKPMEFVPVTKELQTK